MDKTLQPRVTPREGYCTFCRESVIVSRWERSNGKGVSYCYPCEACEAKAEFERYRKVVYSKTVRDIVSETNVEKRRKLDEDWRRGLKKLLDLNAPSAVIHDIATRMFETGHLMHVKKLPEYERFGVHATWEGQHSSGLKYLMLELEDGRRLRFYEFTRYGSYLTEKAEDQPGRPG